jgi:prepilin-type processing-associated H-X9-DG protein
MNVWIASSDQPTANPGLYRIFTKDSDFEPVSPNQIYVFIDEREDSIGDSHFHVDVQEQGSAAKLWALPGAYHGGSGNVSYVDGHAETRRWLDQRTQPPLKKGQTWAAGMRAGFGQASPDNRDIAWLQERSTTRK